MYDTNQAVQPQQMARRMKFHIVELWYLCSENKGADEPRCNRAGYLRHYFCINEKRRFSHLFTTQFMILAELHIYIFAYASFSTRSDTNQAVQPQKILRCFKFNIQKSWELYYLCS